MPTRLSFFILTITDDPPRDPADGRIGILQKPGGLLFRRLAGGRDGCLVFGVSLFPGGPELLFAIDLELLLRPFGKGARLALGCGDELLHFLLRFGPDPPRPERRFFLILSIISRFYDRCQQIDGNCPVQKNARLPMRKGSRRSLSLLRDVIL